jgi:hypothetical protein
VVVIKALGLVVLSILPMTRSAVSETNGIDMGEANGYRYFARPIELSGEEVIAEVIRERTDKSEVLSELRFPVAGKYGEYYGGVSATGKLCFIAVFGAGPEKDTEYVYLYETDNSAEPVATCDLGCLSEEVYPEFFFTEKGLYFILHLFSSGTLFFVNPSTGVSEELISGYLLRFSQDGGYLYYKALGSDKWKDAWTEKGATVPLYPATGEPGFSGHVVRYRLNLATGEKEKLFSATASSILVESGKPADYLGPDKAIDGDLTTAWVEGTDGSGIGESLTIDFGEVTEVKNIGVMPGFSKDPAVFWGNNRVELARFEFSDGTMMTRSFNDKPELMIFELANPIKADSVTITILNVYTGDSWNDTCISEVAVNYW